MMNDFYFYNPVKIYFGRDQMGNLPDIIKQYGKNVLLVYGGGAVKKAGILNKIFAFLDDFTVYELSGVEPNPDVQFVRKGIEVCKKNNVNIILAVGGGSAIDASKWIAAGACVEHDVWDFFTKRTPIDNALPLVTVLTISATGSEMNCGGVLSNRSESKKIGRSSPQLFPKASFLNPEFTYSVGKYQTACGAVDIISHVMEVYFHNQDSMQLLDSISENIIKNVIKYGPVALNNPNDYEARANLMWAASWAINGFVNGPVKQLWNCHIIEHELSARYDITHGHGMAIIIPRWMRYCYNDDNKEVYKKFAHNVLGVDFTVEDSELIEEVVLRIEKLFFEIFGLEPYLRNVGIEETELYDISKSICKNGLISGFRELDGNDVFEILKLCY